MQLIRTILYSDHLRNKAHNCVLQRVDDKTQKPAQRVRESRMVCELAELFILEWNFFSGLEKVEVYVHSGVRAICVETN